MAASHQINQSNQSPLQIIDELIRQHKFNQAITSIESIINDLDNCYDNTLHLRLANVYTKLKRYIQAAKQYEYYLDNEKYKKKINAYFKLGYIYHHHLYKFEEAENMYQLYLNKEPRDGFCSFELAKLLYYDLYQLDDAKTQFHLCSKLAPEKACIWFHRAMLLVDLGEDKNIILYCFSNAIKLKPDVVKYHFHMAIFLESQRKYHEANHLYHS